MHLGRTLAAALAMAATAGAAQAATLAGTVTADNALYVYLSTSPSARGKLIASGNNWQSTFTVKAHKLTPGSTYYLHIEAINYGDQGALIGNFQLAGTGFHFDGGGHTLMTSISHWSGGLNNSNSGVKEQSWVAPDGQVFSQGANGVGPWGNVAKVPAEALWIWPSDAKSSPPGSNEACGLCTVDFSATITPDPPPPQ